jgi:hypothetical protein
MKYLAWLAWLTAFSIIVDIMPVARANSNLFIFKTGFSLLSQCESADGTQNMFCYGYIVGIVVSLTMHRSTAVLRFACTQRSLSDN